MQLETKFQLHYVIIIINKNSKDVLCLIAWYIHPPYDLSEFNFFQNFIIFIRPIRNN